MALFAVTGGGLASCGGSDDGTTTVTASGSDAPSGPIPRSQYIERGDEICADAQEDLDQLEEQSDAAIERGDYAEAADILKSGLTKSRDEFVQLQALPPPDEGAAVIAQAYKKQRVQNVIFAQLIEALRDEDLDRVNSLADEVRGIERELNGVAAGYGFKVCGKTD